jgi:hypothetical protein
MKKDIEILWEQVTEQDRPIVKAWENQLAIDIVKMNLSKNKVIAQILDEAKSAVAECNNRLLTDRKLTELERHDLFTKRDFYEWFLNIFIEAEQRAKSIQQKVADNLK